MKEHHNHAVQRILIALSAVFLTVMLIFPLVYVIVTAFREGIAVLERRHG